MEKARYLITYICPFCDKTTDYYADTKEGHRLRCGDCLMDRTEIVELKVVEVKEVSNADNS
jgi:hypothetical protein